MGTSNIVGLVGLLCMMIFYSLSITTMSYMFPEWAQPFNAFAQQNVNTDISDITSTVDLGVRAQSGIPLVELGTLLFYTGNLWFDLILNFLTALPQMFTLFVDILLSLFNFDVYFTQMMKLYMGSIIFVVQMLGVLQFFANLRSGGAKII